MEREIFSPRSRLCLLRADGAIVGSDGHEADPTGAWSLVLARELCRFHLFPSLREASASRTEAAAEIYCETHPPFLSSDHLKLRAPTGVAIWSWDRERVRDLLGGRPYYRDRILPEPLVHPPGAGWCQRANVYGFEAQYWEAGSIVASMWRRRPFDSDQWDAFTTGVAAPAIPPPPTPPDPEILPLPAIVKAVRTRVQPRWGWTEIERAVASIAILALGIGSFQFAQGIQYRKMAATDAAALERKVSAAEADPGKRQALRDLATIKAFAQMGGGSAPLEAAAGAFVTLDRYGFTILDWKIDETSFQAHLAPTPDLAVVRDAALVLERDPRFENVASRSERRESPLTIDADLEGRAARKVPQPVPAGSEAL